MTEVPKDMLSLFQWRNEFYQKQIDFVNALRDHWEVLFIAGNGSGKTLVFYWNIVSYALGIHPYQFAKPPLKIKVLVHDFEHGYGKIFVETCLNKIYLPHKGITIPPMLSKTLIKRLPSRDDRTVYLNNGSTIFFQTSEQKKRLHSGTNFDILGCEEEAEYQHYDESKRGLRTAKGGGKVLHSFTPPFDEDYKNKGPTWTKFKLVDPFEKGEDPDIFVVKAAMAENPAITEDFIRKFSKGKTEQQLRVQLYGDYPTWGKLIFPNFEDFQWDPQRKMGNLLPWNFEVPWYDPECKFEMAVDWHGSKPCAIIWAFEYLSGPNQGDVIVFDELSPQAGKDLTIMGVSQAIREIEGYFDGRIRRWGDPKMKDKDNALITGYNAWDEFRHNKIRLNEAWNRDPYVGYSVINDFLTGKGMGNLNHPRLFIKENCRTLIHNMKNHYNKQRPDGTAEPDPQFSDYCVCLKYIMQRKSRKIKTGMVKGKGRKKWDQTSYGGNPVGPYGGSYIDYGAYR